MRGDNANKIDPNYAPLQLVKNGHYCLLHPDHKIPKAMAKKIDSIFTAENVLFN